MQRSCSGEVTKDMRIAVSGVGPVGAFGCGMHDLRMSLSARESPIRTLSIGPGLGNVPAFTADTAPLENYMPKRALRRVDHYSRLALLSAHLALEDAALGGIDCERIGIVVATGYGAARTSFAFLDSFIVDGDACASPTLFSSSLHNTAAANISMQLNVAGPSITVSQFGLSVHSALLTACSWLIQKRVDLVLFGGVDELCNVFAYCRKSLFEQTNGFRSTEGIAMGEGACFFTLSRAGWSDVRYGCIRDVRLQSGEEALAQWGGTVIVNCEADTGIGGDIRNSCHNRINERSLSYTALYGDMPVGSAFDMAIAALMIEGGKIFPLPKQNGGQTVGEILSGQKPLNAEILHCMKTCANGRSATITMSI